MADSKLTFRHEVMDADPPGSQHDITLIGDVNGDGRPEIVIGGKEGPPNLFWYENPSWRRHDMADAPHLEAGGLLFDINGNGRLDIFVAEMGLGKNPDPRMLIYLNRGGGGRFDEVVIQRGVPMHEAKVADLTGDGRPDIVGTPYHPERHIDVAVRQRRVKLVRRGRIRTPPARGGPGVRSNLPSCQ